jgi:Protein kinase domain
VSNAVPALVQSELVLGRYRPLRPLGSGGSGSVWLARDEQNGLDVALKIVPREGKAASRAEREAEAAARLRHPSCQRAYGFGRDSQHVYIAYEYVPGRTFREALRGGELNDGSAIEACAQVLEALAHAHSRGIVHRDVKPSNVLLAEGKGVSVRVLDFGLAQIQQAETLTAQGDVPGTLAYIAPERLAGGLTTEAADVWAVGLMLWEALAGRHPFWRGSLLETARAIESGAPRLETARPDLPKSLLAAVDGALNLDPSRRPSAVALAGTLRLVRQKRRRSRGGRGQTIAVPAVVPRLVPPALAAAVAGWTAWALPFFPSGWPLGLAALAAAGTIVDARLGLAFALAVPVLPLGNLALGAAVLYAVIALGLLATMWREPERGLLFSLGAFLAPIAGVGLFPLAALAIRSPSRRAVQATAAVLTAGIVAGIRGSPLPFDSASPPDLGIAASGDPFTVVSALWGALLSRPALAVMTIALAAVAVLLPLARARGLWAIAGLGAAFLAVALLLAPGVAVAPLVVVVWATCLAVAVR